MATAAAIIVGDEVLSGKVVDENTPWLIKRCRDLGLDLVRISVVPDHVVAIAEEVVRSRALADWVFTTGGVGPTHDDVTMNGIASAFEVPLQRSQKLEDLLRNHMGDRCNEAALKMTDLPVGAELWWDGAIRFPVVVMKSVVVFPGIPSLFRQKFDAVSHRFASEPSTIKELRLCARESEIAERLQQAQERWPQVSVGSYPKLGGGPWSVRVILDSRDVQSLEACCASLRESLSQELVEVVG